MTANADDAAGTVISQRFVAEEFICFFLSAFLGDFFGVRCYHFGTFDQTFRAVQGFCQRTVTNRKAPTAAAAAAEAEAEAAEAAAAARHPLTRFIGVWSKLFFFFLFYFFFFCYISIAVSAAFFPLSWCCDYFAFSVALCGFYRRVWNWVFLGDSFWSLLEFCKLHQIRMFAQSNECTTT